MDYVSIYEPGNWLETDVSVLGTFIVTAFPRTLPSLSLLRTQSEPRSLERQNNWQKSHRSGVHGPQTQLMQETQPTANLGSSFLSVEFRNAATSVRGASESRTAAALADIMNILSVR